jgi:hypothetical protein
MMHEVGVNDREKVVQGMIASVVERPEMRFGLGKLLQGVEI